ncbi:hypothetical protein [Streptomyces sp. BE147]|uniref:hypothetical protein n=1 Tax=unclassified Streptomyces TaxID=2593676 RepID=UPI002E76A393|nr:hypothetical protein [Streptomyces sp. BE147]MEE1740536.1 hypothetical protein [Streptomyces sp. BE147]
MRQRPASRHIRPPDDDPAVPGTVHDSHWPGEFRAACGCAVLFLGLLLTVDGGDGGLTAPRVALWSGLALLLFVILLPPRVTAGHGWLESRGPLRRQRVRTDLLVSARWSGGVVRRLVIRDADGGLTELDPRVLAANPALWHLVDTAARSSQAHGYLRYGESALSELSRHIDGATARTIFRISMFDE